MKLNHGCTRIRIANHEIHQIHEMKTGLNMSKQRKQRTAEPPHLRQKNGGKNMKKQNPHLFASMFLPLSSPPFSPLAPVQGSSPIREHSCNSCQPLTH